MIKGNRLNLWINRQEVNIELIASSSVLWFDSHEGKSIFNHYRVVEESLKSIEEEIARPKYKVM